MGLYFYICASLHDIMFMKVIHAIGISIVVLFYCYVMAQHRPNIYVLCVPEKSVVLALVGCGVLLPIRSFVNHPV